MRTVSKTLFTFCLLSGCTAAAAAPGAGDRDRYIDFCRAEAVKTDFAEANPDDAMSRPDWLVHPCSATDWEFHREYRVPYADRQYLSFFCSDYSYTGGAHGSTQIVAGTIDRASGRILKLSDVPAFANREVLQKKLYDAVVAKIGKDALQNEVKPHDNFYLDDDGWHFVFNEYEVACYAAGAIEVVIPR